MSRHEELRKELKSMFDGCLCAADCEQLIVDGLQKFTDEFLDYSNTSEHTMRRTRAWSDAKGNRDRLRKEADAIAFALQFIPELPLQSPSTPPNNPDNEGERE